MLNDYHLIAGAGWSLLNKGEKVIILQELLSGYYLVKATRNTVVKLNMPSVKRNISDSYLTSQGKKTSSSGHYSEPNSPNDIGPVISIMVEHGSDSNLVMSDSFQSNISDDSGIVESSKRASSLSTKDDYGDKSVAGLHLENGNGEVGHDIMQLFKPQSTASLPRNFHISRSNNGKLPTPPISSRIPNSQSFTVTFEQPNKDQVSIPLIGSVPPSILDCYANHMFSPTLVKPHNSNLVLQLPPSKSPSFPVKKKKATTKGNRLSLQVENYSHEDHSPKHKASTLPANSSLSGSSAGQNKPEKKRQFKNFFKKRLSTHGKSLAIEGDIDKELLSVREESMPPDVERVQSPVYGM